MHIRITDDGNERDIHEIHEMLRDYNRRHCEASENVPLGVFLEDETGRKFAGLTGETFGNWLCIWFLFDFVLEFFLAKYKWRYIRTHFIFLLVAIPYQNIIAYYGWTFSPEVTYLLRFIPLLRGGYALAIVVGWLTYNRASSLFVSYLTMLLATVYFASLAFFVLEHKVNPLVTDYGDALWWAFMDVTTVGSNIIAMTTTGRVLSVLLAALGMMMFPIFTVYITNLIQQSNQKKKQYYAEEEEKKEPAQGT